MSKIKLVYPHETKDGMYRARIMSDGEILFSRKGRSATEAVEGVMDIHPSASLTTDAICQLTREEAYT